LRPGNCRGFTKKYIMSVMMISIESYEKVAAKMWLSTFQKTCDINYFTVGNNLTEKQIKEYINIWCTLNEWSYCLAYKEPFDNLSSFLDIRFTDAYDTYQFLKTLSCIRYNIEMETISGGGWSGIPNSYQITDKEKEAYNFLCLLITSVQSTVISQIPAYVNAMWG
jgi:hypothetical protein